MASSEVTCDSDVTYDSDVSHDSNDTHYTYVSYHSDRGVDCDGPNVVDCGCPACRLESFLEMYPVDEDGDYGMPEEVEREYQTVIDSELSLRKQVNSKLVRRATLHLNAIRARRKEVELEMRIERRKQALAERRRKQESERKATEAARLEREERRRVESRTRDMVARVARDACRAVVEKARMEHTACQAARLEAFERVKRLNRAAATRRQEEAARGAMPPPPKPTGRKQRFKFAHVVEPVVEATSVVKTKCKGVCCLQEEATPPPISPPTHAPNPTKNPKPTKPIKPTKARRTRARRGRTSASNTIARYTRGWLARRELHHRVASKFAKDLSHAIEASKVEASAKQTTSIECVECVECVEPSEPSEPSEPPKPARRTTKMTFECPVCLEDADYKIATNCGHVYCADCANRITDTCFVCNSVVAVRFPIFL